MSQPLVSIVTPSFNQAQFIEETLDSILNQSYQNIELIVMDGGSTDDTVDILKNYNDPRLRWESKPDKGQSDAINQGMQKTSGEILAYLNSDDVYLPGTLKFVVEYFLAHPDTDALLGSCYIIDGQSQRLTTNYKIKPITLRDMFKKRVIFPQQSTFWRRRVMDTIGLFDESLHYRMDYDYWIRMMIAGFQFGYTDNFLALYRVHSLSKSLSQDEKFWRDWFTILDKVYDRDDLPAEIMALKPVAYSYAHFYAGESYFRHQQYGEARPFLRQFLTSPGAARQKVFALAMYLDCLWGTSLTKYVTNIYRNVKGVPKST